MNIERSDSYEHGEKAWLPICFILKRPTIDAVYEMGDRNLVRNNSLGIFGLLLQHPKSRFQSRSNVICALGIHWLLIWRPSIRA